MKSILLTLLAVPFLAVAVQAEDAKPAKPAKPKMDPAAAFKKMDKDANNEVSLEEFKATPRWQKEPEKAEGAFKKKDKDADGKLTLEEFSAKPEKPNKPNKPAKEGEPKKP
jgi:Ca2+-binding EF-hand superfamily protein